MDQPTVTITQEEYVMLLDDSQFLAALEDAGVDNWKGINYARQLLREMQAKKRQYVDEG